MNWRNLFTPVKEMSAAELKEYINHHPSGDYQLLDVRQPKEYEERHLPGAMLIPLRELPERLAELDPSKPVIVYCAVGGRSLAAAQFLAGQDKFQLYNLQGGIKAWPEQVARGSAWQGLELFAGGEEFRDAAALAMRMETGLQRLYFQLADSATDEGKALFLKLAGFEARHLHSLRVKLVIGGGEAVDEAKLMGILEGGAVGVALRQMATVSEPAEILALAIGLETQAFDLYLRLAHGQIPGASRTLFLQLADEEKGHLAILATELDKVL